MARKRTRAGGVIKKVDKEESQGGITDPESSPLPQAQKEKEMVIANKPKGCLSPAPFDDDPAAQDERDTTDYSIKITREMITEGKCPRKVRVYADGIYDLFHQGHARQLMQVKLEPRYNDQVMSSYRLTQQAKNVFPDTEVYLLVGCCSDELTHSRKGKTVMDEDERYEAIRHCRYVDEVVKNAPWSLDDEFLQKHKIDFVAHDELPYTTGSGTDVYAHLKAKGMFVATQRTEGVSTSDVVARIVRDYDMYVRRNLARGYTREELNISFFRGQRLKLANKVDEVKTQLHKWEETSKDLIGRFLGRFGHLEWNLEHFWSDGRRRITQAFSPVGSREGSPEPSEDSENEGTEGFQDSSDANPTINKKEEDSEPSPKKLRH
eukprot:10643.XXX_535828_537019_1 [CDS] Oithona nana genome sequencing.